MFEKRAKKEPFVINRENGLFFKVSYAKSSHFVHNLRWGLQRCPAYPFIINGEKAGPIIPVSDKIFSSSSDFPPSPLVGKRDLQA